MKPIRGWQYITINAYWLGINVISGSLTPLILPLLVEHFVQGAEKNTYFALLRSSGLLVAILVQPLAGMLSDRNTSRWGRRRPYILGGGMATLVLLVGIALAPDYWALFVIGLLLQVASNMAHGALQGLIPDLVSPARRGVASGVKTALEIPIPAIIVGFVVGRLVSPDNVWPAMLVVMGLVLASLLANMAVPEQPLPEEERPTESLRGPVIRLVLLTLIFGGGVGLALLGLWLLNNLLAGQGALQLVVMGLAGLAAMAGSIIVGVWLSARVGIGPAVRRNPSFIWWVVNRLLFLAAVGSVRSFALYFLQDVLHVPNAAATVGTMITIIGVFVLLAGLGSGFLTNRLGERRLTALAGLMAAAGVAVFFMGGTEAVYVGGSILGIATGLFFTANWSLGTQLVPPAKAGLYLGVSNLAGAGAGVVGEGIGGPLIDFFNRSSPGLGYLTVFAMYGVMFLIATATLYWVRVPPAEAAGG
ncbi:MAG: MFS transporter [Chloroflexi bacterium]|nr:MFS transporter [Chloroflexota bacterium]MBU1751823.1 MFS transporter [Chloroflexota bacterium]